MNILCIESFLPLRNAQHMATLRYYVQLHRLHLVCTVNNIKTPLPLQHIDTRLSGVLYNIYAQQVANIQIYFGIYTFILLQIYTLMPSKSLNISNEFY
jgi:hypothetical protein